MLDLQTRIHLKEIELAAECVEHELHRARRLVLHGCTQLHRGLQQMFSDRGCQVGRGRLLDHFLVAPLHRAIALAQCDHAAPAVTKQLHFDVARVLDVFFQIDAGILEVGTCQTFDRLECLAQFVRTPAQTHADTATAGGTLDHHRITDARCLGMRVSDIAQQPAAGQQWHMVLFRQLARGVFQAETPHLVGRRPDEHHPRLGALFGKGGVFGKETVTGMDGLCAGAERDFEYAFAAQVTFGCRRSTDAHGFIRHLHMQRTGIGFGIDRHGPDTHPFQGADDAASDRAAIRYQDFIEHGSPDLQVVLRVCRASGRPDTLV